MAAERPRANHSKIPSRFLAMLCPGTPSIPWAEFLSEFLEQLSSSELCRVGRSQEVEMDFSLRASLFHAMFLENLCFLDSAAAQMRIKPKIIGLFKAAAFIMQIEARIADQS